MNIITDIYNLFIKQFIETDLELTKKLIDVMKKLPQKIIDNPDKFKEFPKIYKRTLGSIPEEFKSNPFRIILKLNEFIKEVEKLL